MKKKKKKRVLSAAGTMRRREGEGRGRREAKTAVGRKACGGRGSERGMGDV